MTDRFGILSGSHVPYSVKAMNSCKIIHIPYNKVMSTFQEFLIKKAKMENDLWGLGAGGVAGSLGGLYAGNEVYMQKLEPHKQFINSVIDANSKNRINLNKFRYSKNFDKLDTFHQLLRKDPVEAVKYIATATDDRLYNHIRESMRDLNKPNIKQEALDAAKRRIQNMADTIAMNKSVVMRTAAKQLGLTKDHADTLMNAVKDSNKLARINKIIKPVARRLRGIGLLSGLLAGSGAGLGISRLISD